MGKVFVTMMLLTTIVQIVFAIFLHPFAWCTFCPMGTAASFIAKVKKNVAYQIAISDECTSCGLCIKSCPLQIDIPAFKNIGIVDNTDCMKCQKCTLNCPNKALILSTVEG
jgi:ferredoxin